MKNSDIPLLLIIAGDIESNPCYCTNFVLLTAQSAIKYSATAIMELSETWVNLFTHSSLYYAMPLCFTSIVHLNYFTVISWISSSLLSSTTKKSNIRIDNYDNNCTIIVDSLTDMSFQINTNLTISKWYTKEDLYKKKKICTTLFFFNGVAIIKDLLCGLWANPFLVNWLTLSALYLLYVRKEGALQESRVSTQKSSAAGKFPNNVCLSNIEKKKMTARIEEAGP